MSNTQLQTSFNALKKILKKYEKNLTLTSDKTDSYNLIAGYSQKFKRDIYFGGVEIKKNYVSFHLMPVYINPKLLNNISPELKKECRENPVLILNQLIKTSLKNFRDLQKKGLIIIKK